jgi:hypothetical protein
VPKNAGENIMKIASLILGGLLALGVVASAEAQTSKPKAETKKGELTTPATPANNTPLLDGSKIDEILALARGHGNADIKAQKNGDPKIEGSVGGIQYAVYFMNCTDNKACEDINFYAGFLDLKPSMDVINSWNRDKRFGKAYLDTDGDAVIEMDLNLEHGVSSDNLDAAFGIWELVVDQYTTHVGYKK